MNQFNVDNGRCFDFGKTSEIYAKYRDIYPKILYDKLYKLGVGMNGTKWLDLGTGTGVLPRKLAHYGAKITAVDISHEQILQAKKLSNSCPNITYFESKAEDLYFEDDSFDFVTACQCFWYFEPDTIVPLIKQIVKPDGLFVKIYMGWSADDSVAINSSNLVKSINPSWTSDAASLTDLKNHYFNNPIEDFFSIEIPFTRESWHGRMLSCRGVLGSMDNQMLDKFNSEHILQMEQLPDRFTVKHDIYIISYKL